MSKEKRCIFVNERVCPFQATQVPLQTCELCIEAWKTEVALKKRQYQSKNKQVSSQQELKINNFSAPAVDNEGKATVVNERLKEIDDLLKRDEIDPLEYIRLRKKHVESVVRGEDRLNIEEVDPQKNEIIPAPREVRVAVIAKSLIGKQIYTSPENWELPKVISGKIINTIFRLSKEKSTEEIRLGIGDYKIALIEAEKDKVALMILDSDEKFESYLGEIGRIKEILKKEKIWALALKSIQN